MNIGEAAEATGLPAKTIRYYEDLGLVSPRRDPNGYRHFAPNDLHRLAFLGRSRALGFSIQECRTLLALYDDQGRASADVRAVARQHLDRVDARISELQELRATLAGLVRSCAGDQRPDCPILADLAAGAPALNSASPPAHP